LDYKFRIDPAASESCFPAGAGPDVRCCRFKLVSATTWPRARVRLAGCRHGLPGCRVPPWGGRCGLPRHLESDWARGPTSSGTDIPVGAGPCDRSYRYELLPVAALRRARVEWAGCHSWACRPLSPFPGVCHSWHFRVGLGRGLGRVRVLLSCRRRPERLVLTFQDTTGRHLDACVSRVGRVPLTGWPVPWPPPRGPTPSARLGRSWARGRARPPDRAGVRPRPHVAGTVGRSFVAACGTACGSDPAPGRYRGRLSVRGGSGGDRPG